MEQQLAFLAAVDGYFEGERLEMLAILAGGGLCCGLALVLWWERRDAFSTGFLGVVAISALLLGGTAGALLLRDGPLRASLVARAGQSGIGAASSVEAGRIREVIRKYPAYRWFAFCLAILGFGAAVVWREMLVNGIFADILLLVAAQLVIDHVSEVRARRYLAVLEQCVLSIVPER